jgi:hypothetical protein
VSSVASYFPPFILMTIIYELSFSAATAVIALGAYSLTVSVFSITSLTIIQVSGLPFYYPVANRSCFFTKFARIAFIL